MPNAESGVAYFDGADRRKLEAKEEKLRQSGQEVTRTVQQRQLAFFDMECEFFGYRCDRDSSSFSSVIFRPDVADPCVDAAAT